jgi:polyisoprenoid-binding protein YceI
MMNERRWMLSCGPFLLAATFAATTLGCGASAADALIADGLPPRQEAPDEAERYALDGASTRVEVDINGAVSYTLTFPEISGELLLAADEHHRSVASVLVNMKSATTSNKELERIAKSEDFLDVENYPQATFEVRQLKKKANGSDYEMVGVLDLHGTKKAITVPFTLAVDDCRTIASTEFAIDRRKFGVESDNFLDGMASDDVDIRFRMTVPRAQAPASCSATASNVGSPGS